ncbi:MAG: hypothetical protein ACRDRO_03955 [Pseudonocardiaceae bacterium]
MGSLEVNHLARPGLPWRAPHITECGIPLDTVHPVRITTCAVVRRLVKDIGRQRAMFTTCLTCAETATRWRSEHPDPIVAVHREASAIHLDHGPYIPPDHLSDPHSHREKQYVERRARMAGELAALAALVEAHRDEFDGYLAGLNETVSLVGRRRTTQRRRSR